jgi:hypothetical protein
MGILPMNFHGHEGRATITRRAGGSHWSKARVAATGAKRKCRVAATGAKRKWLGGSHWSEAQVAGWQPLERSASAGWQPLERSASAGWQPLERSASGWVAATGAKRKWLGEPACRFVPEK